MPVNMVINNFKTNKMSNENKLEIFQKERTRIISEMLDNPNDLGIYQTTKCFNELDALFIKLSEPEKPSRLLLAGMAMQGLLANTAKFDDNQIDFIVKLAIKTADSLLRQKQP